MSERSDEELGITFSRWITGYAARMHVRDLRGNVVQELVATGATKARARKAVILKARLLSISLQALDL